MGTLVQHCFNQYLLNIAIGRMRARSMKRNWGRLANWMSKLRAGEGVSHLEISKI